MWSAPETYKDIITNGLDLLSFLLMAPEISTRFVGIAAGRMFALVSLPFVAMAALFVPYLVYVSFYYGLMFICSLLLGPTAPALLVIENVLGVLGILLIIALIIVITVLWRESHADAKVRATIVVARWVVRRYLVLGFIVFMISRAIAFVIAAHEVLTRAGTA